MGERPRERQWLLLDLDLDYLRPRCFPACCSVISGAAKSWTTRWKSWRETIRLHCDLPVGAGPHASLIGAHSDGSVGLFESQFDQFFRRGRKAGESGSEGMRSVASEARGPADDGRVGPGTVAPVGASPGRVARSGGGAGPQRETWL